MEKKTIITAAAQGLAVPDKDGKLVLQKYADKYQSKTRQRSKHVQQTADGLYMNIVQRQMYRRLMYGLKEYTPEQIAAMSPASISQIVTDYQKASRALHVLKAKSFYKHETNLIKAIFPHAKIGDKDFDWLMELPKNATLKKLGIDTLTIVNEFIRRRLLPKDFLTLSVDNIQL
jgi:hypothetical protein